MKIIQQSTNPTAKTYMPNEIKSEELENKKNILNEKSLSKEIKTEWQLDILMEALDNLEKKTFAKTSHPLDNPTNAPIETFDEAKELLPFFSSDLFKTQALQAQANIEPRNLLAIFVEE